MRAAANLLCLSQLMKPQATVILNLVSEGGSGRAAAASSFIPQQRRERGSPTEPARLGLTQTPAGLRQAWLPTAQQGPFVIYLDAYWPYFPGTVMWKYALLEDLRVEAGVSHTLSCSIFSAEFTRTEWLAISPLHQSTTIHAGDGIFKPSVYIRTLKHEAIQNGIFGCHLPLLRHKNQVMILFFLKQLLAWLFKTSVADFKIILQNQKSTDVWNEMTL